MAISTIGPTPVVSASDVAVCETWPPDVAEAPLPADGAAVVVRGVADVPRS